MSQWKVLSWEGVPPPEASMGIPPNYKGGGPSTRAHLQEHNVLWEALYGLEQQALEAEAGPAVGVALLQELHKLLLLVDGLLQCGHGHGEVVHIGGVILDHVFRAQLQAGWRVSSHSIFREAG